MSLSPETITRNETRGSARLWFGVLAGPIAWAVQLGADWFLAEVVACAPSADPAGEIASVPLYAVTVTVNAALLAITAIAALVSARSLRMLRHRGDQTTGGRAEWMARAGLINSVVFTVIIAASYVSIATTRGCMP
ncbi:MAG: hypothetical protein PVF87_02040 [Acidimicrobiia bacterium]|jgi:hypothetical protein